MHASIPDTLINAAHTHAQQGGMSAIFICDDGMQLISEEDRQEHQSAGVQERMVFYANHNIRRKASGGAQGRRVRGTLNRDVREVIVDGRVGRGLDGRVEGRVSCTRTPSCADCQDTLYTYRDAGLYANDGDGAIYTGVCVKEDDVKDWFAGNLNTTQLLEGAKVKTGHTVDWAKPLYTTSISPWVRRALSVLVLGPAAASSTESSSLWQKSVPANHLYIYFLANQQSGRKIILFSQSVSKKEMPPKHEAASWPRKNPKARLKG
ncbi:hypothetical protein B0H10DRAFT_1940634 [Mycena sp. CBHHK59/15]|nr:hypothetical protein B0H10DRAFT_1940634 [Mycena sp. CBHHK59/15]